VKHLRRLVAEIHYLRGRLLYDNPTVKWDFPAGRVKEAADAFGRAIELHPASDATLGRYLAYRGFTASQLFPVPFDAIEQDWKKATEGILGEAPPAGWALKGHYYYLRSVNAADHQKQDLLREAVTAYKTAIQKGSKFTEAAEKKALADWHTNLSIVHVQV